jgi:hypothetical protein
METTTMSAPGQPVLIELVAARIKGEYREMPGLRLTLPQAQRLFGLDAVVCSLALEQLTRSKFLVRTTDGRFGQQTADFTSRSLSTTPLQSSLTAVDRALSNVPNPHSIAFLLSLRSNRAVGM